MAEKKKPFDLGNTLADILGSVPGSDTGREQITYLDINVLDADKENFYSMEGLDELAANIELVGLQQPLRVRENPGMPGRYLIVSGHRRRAAIWTLYEEDPERWGSVPCIIEPAAASTQLQQLRLIYANAGTRQMSSADTAKQAAEVERLLYELKEQGYDFPGRMRDHVAEACKVSKTRLATLKVIRDKLIPELRQLWEAGELNETCAYRLAQAPQKHQIRLTEILPKAEIRNAPEWRCENWLQALQGVSLFHCPDDGTECSNIPNREERAVRHCDPCKSKCCMDCGYLYRCEVCCDKTQAKREQQVAEWEAREADSKAARKKEEEARKAREAEETAENTAAWKRIADAADAAKVDARNVLALMQHGEPLEYDEEDAEELRERASGERTDNSGNFARSPWYELDDPRDLAALADLLHCSTDYLLGRSPEPTPAPAASAAEPLQFCSGHPDHDAVCWCIFAYGEDGTSAQPARWMAGSWYFYNISATIDAECLGWIELPDYEGVLRK